VSKTSAAGNAIALVGIGARGFILFRAFQQLCRRAVNPDMKDPGAKLTRRLPWIFPVTFAVVIAVGIATVWAWGTVVGVALTLASALIMAIAGVALAAYLWLAAEDFRRQEGYVVCEADYADAPRQIKATMRRIYRSAREVRAGRAHQDGMFGELELDRLVFSAGEQAILSSQGAAGIRDLKPDAEDADRDLIADAEAQIQAITAHLVEVEKTLKRSASAAGHLSEKISEPEKRRAEQRAADEAQSAAQDRRRRALEKLEEVAAKAKAKVPVEATDIEERIAAVAAGYDEATQVSRHGIGATAMPPKKDAAEGSTGIVGAEESGKSARSVAISSAKSSVGQASKRAAAGAKRLRNLLNEAAAQRDDRAGREP
jgi:hypothetical protein